MHSFPRNILLPVFLFFALLAGDSLRGQVWEWNNPVPQGDELRDYFCPPSSPVVFACGVKGTLLRSQDLGQTWNILSPPIPQYGKPDLNGGTFVNSTVGYLCGSFNTILKTIDGGVTWNFISTYNTSGTKWNSIFFLNPDTGFVVGNGGAIVKTINGGLTWTGVTSTVTSSLLKIYFSDNVTGYINADTKLLKTVDGGSTWASVYTFPTSSYRYADFTGDTIFIKYYDNNTRIKRSPDGGTTWQSIFLSSSNLIGTIAFLNDSVGYDIRSNSSIWRTIDCGQSWVNVYNGFGMVILVPLHQLLIMSGGFEGQLLRSTNLGNSWNVVSSDPGIHHFYSVAMNPSGQGFAGADTLMMRTNDGGRSWVHGSFFSCYTYADHQYLNSDTMVAVGCMFSRSEDAGISWSPHGPDTIAPVLLGCGFLNSDTGMIVSSGIQNGFSIHRTFDGGNTWDTIFTTPNYTLHEVAMVSSSVAVATSYGPNKLLRTADAGVTWSVVYTGLSPFDEVVAFGDTLYAFNYSEIVRSTDGGVSWTNVSPGSTIARMEFINGHTGIISRTFVSPHGPGTYIYSTSDAGQTWHRYPDVCGSTGYTLLGMSDTSRIIKGQGVTLQSWNGDTTKLYSSFSPDKYLVCPGDTIHFTNHTSSIISCSWDVDGVFQSNAYNFNYYASSPGLHYIGLKVYSTTDSSYSVATINVSSGSISSFTYSSIGSSASFVNTTTGSFTNVLWNFGDGNQSTQNNPSHTYLSSGTYNVCLYTYSLCSIDTFCQTINVTLTSSEELADKNDIVLWPNPANDVLYFSSGDNSLKSIKITDARGATVLSFNNLSTKASSVDISGLADGIYFILVYNEEGFASSRKIIVNKSR
jgi:photosystem II stability/assembly factor-like uncharacterized protein